LRVYYFESETDKLALGIKKTIFREMNDLDLARKKPAKVYDKSY